MKIGARWLSLLLFLWCLLPAAQAAEEKPRIVLISGEYEYLSAETLPPFKAWLEANYPLECVFLSRPADSKLQTVPGLEALEQADLAVFFIRRMTLPEAELNRIKAYASSGKPIIGLRTASHAFENWKAWDAEVLGGNYGNHHGKTLQVKTAIEPSAQAHPILAGVTNFTSDGSLYRNTPLPAASKVLMRGSIPNQPAEPIAWTHSYKGARVFYTSLGHPHDFQVPAFRQMLVNAIYWGLDQPVPALKK